MYTDNNGQSYKLEGDKAIIQHNVMSYKIEIFPTITYKNKTYEVVFPDDCYGLFINSKLKYFTLHKLLHPTTNITSTTNMFNSMKLIKIDLFNLDTSNVTDMSYMFRNCKSITTLDLSNFNTENVKSMNSMFCNCLNLKNLNISSFNTSNLKYTSGMFESCKSICKLNLSSFNTDNVLDMYGMFNGCISLQELNLSSFNIHDKTDIQQMLYDCKSLIAVDLYTFNLEKQLEFGIYARLHNSPRVLSNCYYIYKCIYDVNCNNSYN